MPLLLFISILTLLDLTAAITVYTTFPTGTGIPPSPAQTATCITAGACDGMQLNLISNPTPGNGLTQTVNLTLNNVGSGGFVQGLGGPVSGEFAGFSIELSVANHIFGSSGANLNPIFLNLLATVTSRSGRVMVRVGGNTQEKATVVEQGLPNNAVLAKTTTGFTPNLLISPSLLYIMANISSLLPVDWFIGLPFNDTTNIRPEMAQLSQQILGSSLIGMQLGNEPDLYHSNGLRNQTYGPQDYFNDFGTVVNDYNNDQIGLKNKNNFVAPSVCCGGANNGGWIPEQVWDTGFLDAYKDRLSFVAVQRYPSNNCNVSNIVVDPNSILGPLYLNHTAVVQLTQPYINSTSIVQKINKPFVMLETNTASCSGFSGLSDVFAAALWSVDYNLNMAVNNFTNALYHVGGASAYYNPFTPPPTNQSTFRQWTIGPIMYSTLVTAEAFGSSGKAQAVDLGINNANQYSPGYAIYENGAPTRLVFINYLTDASGGANYTVTFGIGGGTVPGSVTVKYLLAPSTLEKFNITWAGQTYGGPFASDGRLSGKVTTFSVPCDTANNVCTVSVPAPGVALVFLSDDALKESSGQGGTTTAETFSTSVFTKTRNTATINPSVLATSNGRGGQNFIGKGSTSPGSSNGGVGGQARHALAGSVLLVFCSSVLFLISRVR